MRVGVKVVPLLVVMELVVSVSRKSLLGMMSKRRRKMREIIGSSVTTPRIDDFIVTRIKVVILVFVVVNWGG